MMELLMPWIVPAAGVIALLLILAGGYVKAPPDQAYIISGLKKDGKILIGRAGIRIPFFERLDRLYLGQMTVDIKTGQSVPTNDFINVNVDAVAKVRISPTEDGIKLASKNFLNKHPEDITMDLQDSLQGNMREIIGTLSLKEINTDRDSFSDQVMSKASRDMDKLGIEILSCNIQNVTDENGLIKDLGADNTSKLRKMQRLPRLRRIEILPLLRQKQTKLPMMLEFKLRQRLLRRITSLPSKRQSFRRSLTRRRQKLMLPMRFNAKNRKRQFKLPQSMPRLRKQRGKQNCVSNRLLFNSKLWKQKSIRGLMQTVMQ